MLQSFQLDDLIVMSLLHVMGMLSNSDSIQITRIIVGGLIFSFQSMNLSVFVRGTKNPV